MRSYFNSAVVAHAVACADELGILDRLENNGEFGVPADIGKASRMGVEGVLSVLTQTQIIKKGPNDTWLPGPLLNECLAYKGFFTWLFSGCGVALARAAPLVTGAALERPYKDSELIGKACADFGRRHIDPVIFSMSEWSQASCVADLGCGDGSRLIALAEQRGLRVTGIDMSPDIVIAAKQNAARSSRSENITIRKADVTDLEECAAELSDVDTIFLALMGHDLWPRERCIATLRHWKKWFPSCTTLILCETMRRIAPPTEDIYDEQIPSVGYEYLHALMGQSIPTKSEWLEVLAEGGWPCRSSLRLVVPSQTEILTCTRDDASPTG